MATQSRPAKRAKLLSDDESDEDHGAKLEHTHSKPPTNGFQINSEFAKRFEHNKKREEQHRLEEKYGQIAPSSNLKRGRGEDEDSEDSEEDESEDDDAEFATQDVDEEITAALHAIRSKDPKVYDQNVKFYRDFDAGAVNGSANGPAKEEKPMYLHDYHRRNLMGGYVGDGDDDQEGTKVARTYQQEQDDMRRALVGEMHAGADEDEDDLLVAKSRPTRAELLAQLPPKHITIADVAAADRDPESYLSNFMAARAWLPTSQSQWQAFESDDSEDEERADAFEEAYNLRFEDPATANEKLKSFARDVGKYSVRREEKGGSRKKAREREQERKEQAKREKKEEMARLRKLRIEEAEQKVKKIKDAAGLRGKELNFEAWKDVIEGDFDDDKWEVEMRRRFGEDYYDAEDNAGSSKRKLRKPKWDDEIGIKDLVPDFEDDDGKPAFTLSSDDEAASEEDGGVPLHGILEIDGEAEMQGGKKHKTKSNRAKEKADRKRNARRERLQIENLVDASLPFTDLPLTNASSSKKQNSDPGFRYRETSPTSFGLTPRDILFADDAQLNQYAGLKKMAAFRDPEKKKKDSKKLSKKARLRQWRKETFGGADEPKGGFERVLGTGPRVDDVAKIAITSESARESKKKRKRSKRMKTEASEV